MVRKTLKFYSMEEAFMDVLADAQRTTNVEAAAALADYRCALLHGDHVAVVNEFLKEKTRPLWRFLRGFLELSGLIAKALCMSEFVNTTVERRIQYMKLEEIGLRPCKLGKTTISVYQHDTGKLAGLVKGVERCGVDMPMRKRFELRSRYHWPLDIERDCILVDGEAYYVASDRVLFFYEDMQRNHPEAYTGMYEEEHKRHLDKIEAAEACGITVLRLNI